MANPRGSPQNLRPFKKGQSGNPGGKPKGYENLRDLARTFTDAAIKTLADIMQDPKAPAASRIAASTSLLERGWGKPTQHVEMKRSPLDDMTTEELAELLRRIEVLLGVAAGDEEAAAGIDAVLGDTPVLVNA